MAHRGRGGRDAEHEVERHLFTRVLAVGATLLGEFLDSVGPGDLGEAVTPGDGRVLRRLPEPSRRRLVTVFGPFDIPRACYGSRAGQRVGLVPTDQRLQLPETDVSYLLQDWGQLMGVEQPFGTVAGSLRTILGLRQSVDTLEHGNQQMAEAAAAFRAQQPAPDPEAEGSCWWSARTTRGPDGPPGRGRAGRGAPEERGESQQEADGVHRRGLHGRPAGPHARGGGRGAVPRPGPRARRSAGRLPENGTGPS